MVVVATRATATSAANRATGTSAATRASGTCAAAGVYGRSAPYGEAKGTGDYTSRFQLGYSISAMATRHALGFFP